MRTQNPSSTPTFPLPLGEGQGERAVPPRAESVKRLTRTLLAALTLAALPAVAAPFLPQQDANLWAAVGGPYLFNPEGAVRAVGTGTLRYSVCEGPGGFRVDAVTGAVRWTPVSPGTTQVCLRVQDANLETSDLYLAISVLEAAPQPPAAHASATPAEGPAPLTVTLDASSSTAAADVPLRSYAWHPSDASLTMHGPKVTHTYAVPGGYQARVVVRDEFGSSAESSVSVRVKDALGHTPPSARIVASSLRGRDSLSVDFTCDCAEGDSAIVGYRWDLGEGTLVDGETAHAVYAPGRYHARLAVVDAKGLVAWDEVEVVVWQGDREPPECRAAASMVDPTTSPETKWLWTSSAVAPAGSVAKVEWWLDGPDGNFTGTGRAVSASYSMPGWYGALVKVVDDAGLSCTDRSTLVVPGEGGAIPPRIITVPGTAARCGEDYAYGASGPHAVGTGPLTWSLKEGPEGLEVEADGTFTWLPTPSQRGPQAVALEVHGPAGTDIQTFSVEVSCPGELGFGTGGCGAASGAVVTPAVLLWVMAFRR